MALPNVFDFLNKNANLNTTINVTKSKKIIEEKNKEKAKIFGFLGMEAYELYKNGKLEVPDLDVYFEKAKEIEEEIAKIEGERQKWELETKGNSTCSCGCQLTTENRFCPGCGKPVENGMNTCKKCGKSVKTDMQFCPFCGNDTDLSALSVVQKPMKTCICGALIPLGQFMCMECGRKVE